jgi:hypothetical protein
VLLLGDLLPGGERMLGMGSPERALALTKLLTLGSSKKMEDHPVRGRSQKMGISEFLWEFLWRLG